jgi:hypothetical protein
VRKKYVPKIMKKRKEKERFKEYQKKRESWFKEYQKYLELGTL